MTLWLYPYPQDVLPSSLEYMLVGKQRVHLTIIVAVLPSISVLTLKEKQVGR